MSFCVIALAMLYYTDDVANNVELRWLMQLAKTALIALVYVRIKINYIKTGFVVAIGTIALLSPNLFVVYLLATWLGMFFTIH